MNATIFKELETLYEKLSVAHRNFTENGSFIERDILLDKIKQYFELVRNGNFADIPAKQSIELENKKIEEIPAPLINQTIEIQNNAKNETLSTLRDEPAKRLEEQHDLPIFALKSIVPEEEHDEQTKKQEDLPIFALKSIVPEDENETTENSNPPIETPKYEVERKPEYIRENPINSNIPTNKKPVEDYLDFNSRFGLVHYFFINKVDQFDTTLQRINAATTLGEMKRIVDEVAQTNGVSQNSEHYDMMIQIIQRFARG
ncbi:MAG: hypothetical protein IPK03_16750 [Bacteroidetes bacterium]|nr:hypothetical protein [Bacteroidota bacterium]